MADNFSIKGFYENVANGGLRVPHCRNCQDYVMPPTSICANCLSTDLEWAKISQKGRVVSFSEIHVSNKKFQPRTPYVVSIVETEEGVRLPGIIKDATAREMRIGDTVSISVSSEDGSPSYFFNRLKNS